MMTTFPVVRWRCCTIAVIHHSQRMLCIVKVELLVGVKVIRHIKGLRYPGEPVIPTARPMIDVVKRHRTGLLCWRLPARRAGRRRSVNCYRSCPVRSRARYFIAQHIADGFAKNMVHWLDSVTDLKVRLAQEDDRVEAGYVYILPPEQHLIVKTTSV